MEKVAPEIEQSEVGAEGWLNTNVLGGGGGGGGGLSLHVPGPAN